MFSLYSVYWPAFNEFNPKATTEISYGNYGWSYFSYKLWHLFVIIDVKFELYTFNLIQNIHDAV